MKNLSFLICFVLCANAYANVSPSNAPTLDTRAPGYFSGLIKQSDYVVAPVYDSKTRSKGEAVVTHDRTMLDHLAEIFSRVVYTTSSHLFAVQAGGPVKFYSEEKKQELTLEKFGRHLRLNGQDYELDGQSSRAISEWLKKSGTPQTPSPSTSGN